MDKGFQGVLKGCVQKWIRDQRDQRERDKVKREKGKQGKGNT
jgi:hypothetical protein